MKSLLLWSIYLTLCQPIKYLAGDKIVVCVWEQILVTYLACSQDVLQVQYNFVTKRDYQDDKKKNMSKWEINSMCPQNHTPLICSWQVMTTQFAHIRLFHKHRSKGEVSMQMCLAAQ